MHRLDGVSCGTFHTAHAVYMGTQAVGETVRTARSARGNTGTRAGPNGETGGFTRQLHLRIGPLHRETAWLGWARLAGGTKLPKAHALPRRLPTPAEEADENDYGVLAGRRGFPRGRRPEQAR